jgi:hypothetical protein
MRNAIHIIFAFVLFSSFLVLSSLKEPAKAQKGSSTFCNLSFGADNQAITTCTLTEVRLSPLLSGAPPLLFNVSYSSGQSGMFAFDPLGLGNPVTIKGRITGTWSSISAIRASDGANLGTYISTGGSTYALFGIPNTCDTITLVVN